MRASLPRNGIVAHLSQEPLASGCSISVRAVGCDAGELVAWWDIEGAQDTIPGVLRRHDLALVAFIFRAMRERRNLHVAGPVSRSLLENAERFMQIWAAWRPDDYGVVTVSADEEVDDLLADKRRDDRAVCAFSGGVDATCSVWRHSSGRAGRTGRSIYAGVLVQGFDIPLEDDAAFETTKAFCKVMLDDLDIPMVTIRTNWKRDISSEWVMEFGAGIIACLTAWEEAVSTLIVGSCEDYGRLVTPWGSHPLPTSLLAARDTRLLYDGGDLNRTQKVREISDWPVGYDNLRVCWEGEKTGKNCGVCEKCIRTKLNAIVAGKRLPASLPEQPTVTELSKIVLRNEGQAKLWQEILDEAVATGFDDPILRDARRIASTVKPRSRVRSRARRIVKRMRKSLGTLVRASVRRKVA